MGIIDKLLSFIRDKLLGCEQKTLLWENAALTSPFPGQKLPLDLSDFDYVDIYPNTYNSPIGYGNFNRVPIGKSVNISSPTWVNLSRRTVTVDSDGITFSDGMFAPTYNSTAATTSNIVAVPIKVVGIKRIGGGIA